MVERIPRGRVSTYGDIALFCGLGRNARLVGYALHALPEGMEIPWHRVVNARGAVSLPPESRSGRAQRARLAEEGVTFRSGFIDMTRHRWRPRRSTR